MKKVIKGKVYDTETAQKVGDWDNGYYTNDFQFCAETLYRKKTGGFFLHGEGHAMSIYASHSGNSSGWGEKIIPMTYTDAQEWAEKHLDGDEYIKIFGEPEEDGSTEALNIRISSAKLAKLRQEAGKRGVSLVALVEELIETL